MPDITPARIFSIDQLKTKIDAVARATPSTGQGAVTLTVAPTGIQFEASHKLADKWLVIATAELPWGQKPAYGLQLRGAW